MAPSFCSQVSITQEKEALLKHIRDSIIGEGTIIDGPFGERLQTYVDFTASGKALNFVESYIASSVLPLYANTHTESSYTGAQTNILREEARAFIKEALGATDEHALVFTGCGVTAAVAKLMGVMGLQYTPDPEAPRPVVFVGPFEHHSNDITWRETTVDVVRINEDANGLVDLVHLEQELKKRKNHSALKIGSFSAASNVTGIITDTNAICKLIHKYGGVCFVDCATAGPYLEINLSTPDSPDAVFLSPHKFVGGPGTPGILVAKKSLFTNAVPTIPGGGTVLFTSPTEQIYDGNIEAREEAGTPDIVGSIRAGLAFMVKKKVGEEVIHHIESAYARRAIEAWSKLPNIKILGNLKVDRLAIVSFTVAYEGRALHHNFVSLLLSDLFGIQVRSGCSCAGPYGHSLLNVDNSTSNAFKSRILEGYLGVKPGWVRLNFPYWMEEHDFQFILDAVSFVVTYAHLFLPAYSFNFETGSWTHATFERKFTHLSDFQLGCNKTRAPTPVPVIKEKKQHETDKRTYLKTAADLVHSPDSLYTNIQEFHIPESFEQIRWFWLPSELAQDGASIRNPVFTGGFVMNEPKKSSKPKWKKQLSMFLQIILLAIVVNFIMCRPEVRALIWKA